MNYPLLRYLFGMVLMIVAAFLALPLGVAVIYGESTGIYFLYTMAAAGLLGFLLTRFKPARRDMYAREGFVLTALAWVVISLIGAAPFTLSGQIPSYLDAVFETVSGFTTTGASVLSDVEALSHCALLWRSLTHWIGGMGVLVFLLAVVPLNGGYHMNLMRAESPGPSVGKLVPKVRATARILYLIYIGMTALELLLLLLGRMPTFEAICTSMATAGTGGFGLKNDSMASYSPYIQWVVAIFMLLFAVNFNAYYLLLLRRFREALSMEEVHCFFGIVGAAILVIFCTILKSCAGVFDALTKTVFQVASVVSSTGYCSTDFNLWPQTARLTMVLLMFVGACAGSTGGGFKVSRLVILVKSIKKELGSYIHPKSVKKVRMDGKPIEHEVVRSTNVYFITFMLIYVASVFLVSLEGQDLGICFTAVLATLNNIGPGLNAVGPAANFGGLAGFSKWVLIFDMLAGRLELFPVLILFHPALWKEALASRRKQ